MGEHRHAFARRLCDSNRSGYRRFDEDQAVHLLYLGKYLFPEVGTRVVHGGDTSQDLEVLVGVVPHVFDRLEELSDTAM